MDFFLCFYLNVKIFLIIAKVNIQTCVNLNGVKNENILYQIGMISQVSVFGVCRFGN
jgi:hypothetical protein